MNCVTCRSTGVACGGKNAKNSNAQAVKREAALSVNPSRPGSNTNVAIEALCMNGFIYEKCKFCGSIIVRRIDDVSQPDNAEFIHSGARSPNAADPAGPPGLMPVYYEQAQGDVEDERKKSELAYGLRLNETGCRGICIQYDTRSCDGSRCINCEVLAAGLCCKRYLTSHGNSNVLERDGGDYRNLMSEFIRRYKNDKDYDIKIRQKLMSESAKADAYRDGVRKQVAGASDANLVFEWREYSLDDLLAMFPHCMRRPVRIEIQLLIYMFYNYRYPIDLEHAEARFQLPRLAINRYLRAYFGHSYSSLLAKIRNEHSKILLRIPLLRIGEIGALVGYKSHYHYSLNFKRYEGISPKEYRQSFISAASHM